VKNVTLLRQNIREVLAQHCTGMDDHGACGAKDECYKCEDMEDALIEAVENWRVRAYKTTKGKV
jgi:hypothetical protein